MPDTRLDTAAPTVRTKIYVGPDMIGAGKIDLLRAIATTGSLSAAARAMGLGARRARFLLGTLEGCFATPLVQKTGRGSRLTPLGHDLIAHYDQHIADIEAASAPFLAWLSHHQAAQRD